LVIDNSRLGHASKEEEIKRSDEAFESHAAFMFKTFYTGFIVFLFIDLMSVTLYVNIVLVYSVN